MTITWNPVGDFAAIVDASETIVLLRRGSRTSTDIDVAWRYSHRTTEREPSDGYAPATDVVWQFEWPAEVRPPQVGDRIRDTKGEYYTLLAVERTQGNTRLKCEARNLRIAHGLDCLVDIQLAVWDAGAITGWTTFRPAVHARIQPLETTVDESSTPITSTTTYRVLLDDDTPLDHNHRLASGDGTVYRLVSYSGGERLGDLAAAVVRRE
ncbi:hypothetical protein NG895_17845 [Aeoliella sp. ICT_H6.2]|uniref:Uncharacterized protein n=1 Tax=Aeoliella straminimaris TaxID=2954799 RepID=A0A9X2JK29_9BACT|nr:hypothetical protein [Aeoliella straminimaris]MCO6045764.1 hypothetical protein [Aeoliella straminimaris]